MQKKYCLVVLELLVAVLMFSIPIQLSISFYDNHSNPERSKILELLQQKAKIDEIFEVIDEVAFQENDYSAEDVDLYVMINTKVIGYSESSPKELISSASILFQGDYFDTFINSSALEDYQLHSDNIYKTLVDKKTSLFEAIIEEHKQTRDQAVQYELENYASQAIQFWKTPVSQGGAGQKVSKVNTEDVSIFLGFMGDNLSLITDNGEFRVISCSGDTVVLKGVGCYAESDGNYQIDTVTVNLSSGIVKHQKSLGKSF